MPSYPFDRKRYWIQTSGPAPAAQPFRPAVSDVPPDFYELRWIAAPPLTGRQAITGSWAVVGAAGGLTHALAQAIRAAGAQAEMIVPRTDRSDLAETLNGRSFDRVIDVAADRTSASGNAADDAEARVQELRALTQALIEAGGSPRLWVVTSGATGGRSPAQAALWGFGRTIALEHPRLWGGAIDVDNLTADRRGEIARAILDECAVNGAEDQIVLHDTERRVARLARTHVAQPGDPKMSAAGTYLLTGGLGAIGSRMARWLADKGARSIVLIGRHAPDREPSFVAGLRDRGVDVCVAAADVSRDADVARVLDDIRAGGRPLKGIVHAAGVDVPESIARLSAERVHDVMAGKSRGAWLLHQHTSTIDLDFFIVCSSLSSVLGSADRAPYAAANAFLDAIAASRHAAGLPALSVAWGPWSGGGIANADTLRQFAAIGNYGLSPDTAIECLERALGSGKANLVVAAIDWDRFLPAYSAQRERPLLAGVAMDELHRHADTATEAETETEESWNQVLASIPEQRRHEELVELIRTEAAETIGIENTAEISASADLFDIGLDSLLAAELASRLKRRIGLQRSSVLFEHPVLQDLAAVILRDIALPTGTPSAARATTATASAARTFEPASMQPVSAVATKVASGVTTYTPADAPAVFSFCREAWPHRREDLIEPRWRWMFEASAKRLDVPTQVWLSWDNGRVVGHNGTIPVRAKLGESVRQTGWLVDTMVLKEHRPRGVGAQLMLAAHEGLPFALSLGQTDQMRSIQFRLGWEQVAPLKIAQLLLRPENVLKGKAPAGVGYAAGLGLRAAMSVRDLWAAKSPLQLSEIDLFDDRHTALWRRMSEDVICAVERDASYLNWKYVDQPGQSFVRLDVRNGENLVAATICLIREPDQHYRYVRAFLVDYVGPLADPAFIEQVFRAVSSEMAGRGADALLCYHTDQRLTDAARANGFQLRQPERYVLVRPEGLSAAERQAATAADAWFVTHGDSDIDRPW